MPNCLICELPIASKYGKKFCSIKCSATSASRIRNLHYPRGHTLWCLQCKQEFRTKDKRRKFCTNSCSALYSNPRRACAKPSCVAGCGNLVSENAKKFCSRLCAAKTKKAETLLQWRTTGQSGSSDGTLNQTIREYIFGKFNNSCSSCGWARINPVTRRVPLQIHHGDGNSENDHEGNLELLCPNCHSLTPTFGSLNAGNGRKKRHQRR